MIERVIRLWWCDWRHNRDWVLFSIICFCLFVLALLQLLSASLKETTLKSTNQIVGADWVLESSLPAEEAWLDHALQQQLRYTQTLETTSVILHQEKTAWVGIKAVGRHYPLVGNVLTQSNISSAETPRDVGPEIGEVWVSPRVYHQLGLTMGEEVSIGYATFRLTALILDEPDRSGRFYDLAPRVMINWQDVPATRLIQAHSRATYRTLLVGDRDAWARFEGWLKPQLRVHDQLKSALNLRPGLKGALEKAKSYYDLIGLVAFLLSGSALMLIFDRYLRRQTPKISLFTTMGYSRKNIVKVYALQWLWVSCLAFFLTLFLALTCFNLLKSGLAERMWIELESPGVMPAVQALIVALFWLWCVGAICFAQVLKLPPLIMIRGLPSGDHGIKKSVSFAAIACLSVILFGGIFGRSFFLVLFGLLLWASLVFAVLYVVSRLLKPKLPLFGLRVRLVFRQWFYRPGLFFLQVITMSFILLSSVTIYYLKVELFDTWSRQMPQGAPNYFLMNIFDENIQPLRSLLASSSLKPSRSYPIVRGRLTKINEQPVLSEVTKEAQPRRRVNRELNLTWTHTLPYENHIVAGSWLTHNPRLDQVSVESELAERLGIQLGDELTFSVAAKEIKVSVTSLRKVEWDTMLPNFYMIFPPGLLDKEAFSYLMSLYIPSHSAEVIAQMAARFPEVNIIGVDVFLSQVKKIKDHVSLALEFANLILLISVCGVLFAAINSTWDERLLTYSISQLVGMEKQWVVKALIYEYALLGLASGVIASLASEGLAYWLYTNIFNFDWAPSLWLFLFVPTVSALMMAAFAGLSSYVLLRKQAYQRTRALLGR